MDEQAIELLTPRVKGLSELFGTPIHPGDVNEKERERKLGRWVDSLAFECGSDMRIIRKLEDIYQSLTQLSEQGRAMELLTDAKNAQKVNSLVEDIREVLMDYQVCMPNYSFSTVSDLSFRLHCNKIFTMRAVNLLQVSPHYLLFPQANQQIGTNRSCPP